MKHSLTFLVLSCIALMASAENVTTPESVISKTSETLNNLKSISYSSYREINNFKDNYFAKNSGSSYFEYDATIDGKVARFQLQNEKSLQVYNGTEYFLLDDADKTVELEKRTAKQMGSISLLYNSVTTLRIVLPLLLKDQNIPKSLKDTVIEGKSYDLVQFALNKKSMEFPSGFTNFDSEVIKYYKLIIDKETALPYMVFDGNSILKDQYYTKTIFTNINVNPKSPAEDSWYSSSYKGYEQKKEGIQNPMIKVGSILQNWSLPKYDPKKSDLLKSSDLNGKIVLMEFWIKNCGYCMLAFPEIKELEEKYGKKIEIVSVNAYDKKSEIDFFYNREKPKYQMLYNGEKFANSLGIYAYPASIILDKSGKVIYTSRGFDKEGVEKFLKGIL
ncbi:TlpA family protein disulfide reductase [Pedobacter sp. UC225_65]|uniref:TlpA family protein disulfide reductase n=1 Tax=Pedobacter sp. UC225_65 TaxID=3350173 RepID=UPI00366A6E02